MSWLKALVVTSVLALSLDASAGGRVDWSDYIDHNASRNAPVASASKSGPAASSKKTKAKVAKAKKKKVSAKSRKAKKARRK